MLEYRKSGFESDVVFRDQPPAPEKFGLVSSSCRLQLLTEFLNSPEPLFQSRNAENAAEDVKDVSLQFGSMRMARGKAFAVGSTNTFTPISVYKSWVHSNQRKFLIEEVNYSRLAPQLATLGMAATRAALKPDAVLGRVSRTRMLPPAHLARRSTGAMQLAKVDLLQKPGVVLDYDLLNSETTLLLQGDTTYFCSGAVYCTNLIVEGGTVVKYPNNTNSFIEVDGSLDCQTTPYWGAAIFTAGDDDSAGESLKGIWSGYTGTIQSGGYANPALSFYNPPVLENIHLRYAQQAVTFSSGTPYVGPQLYDCQILNSGYGIVLNDRSGTNDYILLVNCLAANVGALMQDNMGGSEDLYCYNCTIDNCSEIMDTNAPGYLSGSEYFAAVNSLFSTAIFPPNSEDGIVGSNNGFYHTASFGTNVVGDGGYPYQTAGEGSYYLVDSTYRGAGTTNVTEVSTRNYSYPGPITAVVGAKTTYPPIVFSNVTISVNTNLGRQVSRDTGSSGAVDIGYHYPSLDYSFYSIVISNSSLTLTSGVVVAIFEGQTNAGISFQNGGQLISQGTATAPNWLVAYNLVQEQPGPGVQGLEALVSDAAWTPGAAAINTRFTGWSVPAQDTAHILCSLIPVSVIDCEFHGGGLKLEQSFNITNSLLDRVYSYLSQSVTNPVTLGNNLFHYGAFEEHGLQTNAIVRDNFFEYTTNILDDAGWTYTVGHNAYITNYAGQMNLLTADLVLTNDLAWVAGPFGNYYQPSNSPTIHAGSTNANLVALFQYTVMTNLVNALEIKEGTNLVSCGLHYVAVDANGNPIDTGNPTVPDYLADANGNGLDDPGEIPWSVGILSQPTNETVIVGSNATFTVVAQGQAPLSYQWYFNSAGIANATSATLTITNVQMSNAGTYFVVVSNSPGSITSSNAILTVLGPPTVAITNPVNNTVLIASTANIALMATATNVNGTISQVQFYQETSLLGTVTNPPYNLTWSNVATGVYGFTAVALNNYGLSATSPVVEVTVSPVFATNNLRLWLQANAITVLTNNGLVGTWPDSSGWTNNATGITGSQPAYQANGGNGFPAVLFTVTNGPYYGVGQYLSLPNVLNNTTGAEAFAVLKVAVEVPSIARSLWSFGPQSPSQRYPEVDGTIHDNLGRTTIFNIGQPAQPLTQYHLYDVGGQSNFWGVWINGVLQSSTTNNTYAYQTTPEIGTVSGYYGVPFFDGDIAEILVFDRVLTSAEKSTVGSYLALKYGLASLPPAPTNLAATAISASQISLTWGFGLGNVSTTFQIERKMGVGGTYAQIATVQDGTSYLDTSLAAGTQYYYRVRALNFAGESGYSNEANATTDATGTDLPLGSLALWLKADTGLTREFTNNSVTIWFDQSGNYNNATQTTSSSQPAWLDNTLDGRPIVRFTAANGDFLALPNVLNNTTGAEAFVVLKAAVAVPSASRSLWSFGPQSSLERYPETDGSIRDNFGSTTMYNIGQPAQPLNQYHLYNVAGQSNFWGAWINGELQTTTTNNTYAYQTTPEIGTLSGYHGVPFFDGDIAEMLVFDRVLSSAEKGTVGSYLATKYGLATLPAAPTNLAATAVSASQISLTWGFGLGNVSTTFQIERKTGAGGAYAQIATVQDGTSYVDTNLAAATQYYYRTRAYNFAGESGYSNETNATTAASATDLPLTSLALWLKADTGLAREFTNNSVAFWSDQSGNGNNAAQTALSSQPAWLDNTLNARPIVRFNGTNGDFLTLPNVLNNTTGAEAFVVLKAAVAVPSTSRSLWSFGAQSPSGRYPETDGTIRDNLGSTTIYNIGTPPQPLNQYHLYNVAGQANFWGAWINGVLQSTTTNNTYAYQTTPEIGTLSGYYGVPFFDGDIAEVLVFRRVLAVDERDAVGNYLAIKYNLSLYATNAVAATPPTNLVTLGVAPVQLNLQWILPSTNLTSLHVEREPNGGSFQEIAELIANATNFLDTSAAAATQYFYRVRAHNLFGDSYSPVISPPTANLTNLPVYILENANNWLTNQSIDAYGTVSNVEFFANYALINSVTSSPFATIWRAPMEDVWTLSTLAMDNLGNSQYSAPVTVTVYLDSNGDGIPDILQVSAGNDPLNPWTAPPPNTNDHTAPIITLLVPTNAVIVP